VVETERLAQTFVRLADTLVDDFDVLEVLHTLTTQCAELLDAAAVGLLLADSEGTLHVTVASTESARLLDLFQLQNDEGPCLECYHEGETVGTTRLDAADSRWPRFAAAAVAEGYTTVLALPLRLRGEVIGALNVFGDARGAPISHLEIPIAQALADVATIAILTDRLARDRNLLTEQLQMALNSRVAIEQAKGAVANQLNIGPDQAFVLLRDRARSTRRRLVEVAEDVVRGGANAAWEQSAPDAPRESESRE
jgi:GAF domain-containing protein